MNVLVACEESQAVCCAFREKGHNAFSCDLQTCSGGHPEWHILGDALKAMEGGKLTLENGDEAFVDHWDLMIAHPPCTYLSNAGACRLYPQKGVLNQERYQQGLEAKEFFMKFYNSDIPHIAIENPIPSSIFKLPVKTQVVQPYEYGEPYSKKTYLWLKNLPMLKATNVLDEYEPYVNAGTKKANGTPRDKKGVSFSAKHRSKTFLGIAKAMADQWG